MSGLVQSAGKLVWAEFLSAVEIRDWCSAGKKPIRLKSQFAIPGVYRFVFPESKDEHGQHVPCYVGQSRNLAGRIPYYFRQTSQKERRDENGEIILPDGWHVRGCVLNSGGIFTLQVLTISGAISLNGVVLSQNDLDNTFARVLLENWAILSSELIDKMSPTNRGIAQSIKELFES
jgi:hypothetical protein